MTFTRPSDALITSIPSIGMISDAIIAAPGVSALSSNAAVIPSNRFMLNSDAVMIPPGIFFLSSDAWLERGPTPYNPTPCQIAARAVRPRGRDNRRNCTTPIWRFR